MTQPITPDEVGKAVTKPDEVIEAFNELICRNWDGHQAIVRETDAVAIRAVPTKLSDSRANNYIAEFGMECWELDALEPEVIANLIEDEILSLRDEDKFEEVKNQEDAEKEELDQIRQRYHEVVDYLNDGH